MQHFRPSLLSDRGVFNLTALEIGLPRLGPQQVLTLISSLNECGVDEFSDAEVCVLLLAHISFQVLSVLRVETESSHDQCVRTSQLFGDRSVMVHTRSEIGFFLTLF